MNWMINEVTMPFVICGGAFRYIHFIGGNLLNGNDVTKKSLQFEYRKENKREERLLTHLT